MAERPFLKLGPKEWLSGLASGAHAVSGGIFYKANGITPLYDAGGTASPENGMLQAGPTPTDFTASVVIDNIIAGADTIFSGTPYLYMMGSGGNFYRKGLATDAVTNLRSGANVITNPCTGMEVWAPAGGTTLLYYWNNGKIGTWNLSGSYPTGWTDNVYDTGTTAGEALRPTHKFVGNIYYGNATKVGAITDAGSGTAAHNANVLDFPSHTLVTDITDDGTYLVVSVTSNEFGGNTFASNKVYFWDTFSSSWTREYEIRDPFIYGLQNVGSVVYAFGQYGIYEGTIGSGFKKILSRTIGFGTPSNLTLGYGANRATTYNGALTFATDTTVDTLGKIQPDVPNSYMKPFKVSSGVPTAIFTSLDAGRIYVATNTPKFYAYDFNNTTHDTGNTAQTVYFQLPTRTTIKRIDLVFGEPLASGDAISAGIFTDEDTAVKDFGAATFTTHGAKRRVSLGNGTVSATCEDQMSLLLTFTSGAVKLKYVEIFGDSNTP